MIQSDLSPGGTVVGNLTADPELRFTNSGAAVANFTVASTPRIFDRQSGEWRDGETLFMRCTIWRQLAEHLAESLTRGARVIVVGRLEQRSFTAKDGTERIVVELVADEVAPSLRYATAKVNRTTQQAAQQQGRQGGHQRAPGEDPWSGQQPPQGGSHYSDEPPF